MGTEANRRRYAFIFVCQSGELEAKALLLAASLRRFLRGECELIAAIPQPAGLWGTPAAATTALLAEMGVRTIPIVNELDVTYPIGNKLACLKVAVDADRMVFVDSDIVAVREFHEQPRFGASQFCAKPADLQRSECNEETWRRLYQEVGAAFPSLRFPATASREFGLPYFNAGFIVVDPELKFGEAWLECCQRILEAESIPKKRVLDQVGLPLAIARLGLAVDYLDERYNYPAHLKPLDPQQLPYFCHYHRAEVFLREPPLRDLLQSLLQEHPGMSGILKQWPEWCDVLDAATASIVSLPGTAEEGKVARPSPSLRQSRRPPPADLVITGIPRSGTSYLCNLLHRFSNCVIVNEPAEVFQPLVQEAAPWGIARIYAQIRSDVCNGRGIQNKLRDASVVEDTMALNERSAYTPKVDNEDFVLGTKNTHAYLTRLSGLRRVLPDARIVVCVRDPFATIASWKTSFPHLRDAKVNGMRVGNPRDPALTARQAAALQLIAATDDPAQRRAMWWSYLGETILEHGRTIILVRYPDLITNPEAAVNRILDGFSAGSLLEPITPSVARSKRSELEAADEEAIRAICSQTAAELGVADPEV